MKKVKLSKKAVQDLIAECQVKEGESGINFPIIDPKNPEKVTTTQLLPKALGEKREELKYLLGQLAVFHTSNKVALYEQLAFLHTGENWTESNPLILSQLVHMAVYTGLLGAVERTEIKGKKVDFTNLNPLGESKRVKPVTHEEKTEKEPSLDD